jgi:HD-GYP domain-containing protein (c-di-GMP phosphodiesterase class II)
MTIPTTDVDDLLRRDAQSSSDHETITTEQFLRESWRIKYIALFVAMNAACLGLGLWIHARSESTPLLMPFTLSLAIQGVLSCWIFSHLYSNYSRQKNAYIEVIDRHQDELERTREALMVGLSRLASSRDGDQIGHDERVGQFAAMLAESAQLRPEFENTITPQFIRLIRISAGLHDIGKVGIEDAILMKSGSLSDAERARMQAHPKISSDCFRSIEAYLGNANFLQMAHEIALFHHERWDGSGYPTGISGPLIPLSARIVAIADVYDALSSRRCYKEPYAHKECVALMLEGRGTQFDPLLIDVFLEIQQAFREVSLSHQDRSVVDHNKPRLCDDPKLLESVLSEIDDRVPAGCFA